MTEFFRIIGRSLLLPLAVLPFGVGMILIGGTTELNFPFVEVGSQILRHMPLFFAIGLALSSFRAGRVAIILAVVIGYALVLLAVQGVLMALTFLAENTFLAQQWQTYAAIAGFFVVCYLLIFILDRVFNLRRSARGRRKSTLMNLHPHDAAGSYIYTLGGQDNIVAVDNCATRLLVTVKDSAQVDGSQLKALGVNSVIEPSDSTVQIATGRDTEFVASAIRDLLYNGDYAHHVRTDRPPAVQKSEIEQNGKNDYDPAVSATVLLMIDALGGAANIVEAGDTAKTRLRVVVRDEGLVDEDALRAAGASGVMTLGNTFHILLGIGAEAFSAEMQHQLHKAREHQ